MIRLATALALAASAAAADEFTIFIYETPAEIALRADPGAGGRAYWADFAAFGATMAEAGLLRGGAPLAVDGTGDSPVLSGYFRIEAPSLAAAEALALRAPSVARGGDAVALPHVSMPGMAN